MRIEKVADDKIKVMIEESEAKAWNLSFKSIAENTPEAQRIFRIALRLAEENADFSVQGAKLFVEAVKSEEDSGFGMLITRVQTQQALKEAISACSYSGKIKHSRLTLCKKAENRELYRFSDFETVVSASEQIMDIFKGESMLYRMDDRYYLYLVPEETCPVEEIRLRLCEFSSSVVHNRYMHGKLNEYGECMIAEDALLVMQEYFCLK
ncbi:MAG: adaptor protein MecA [Clostridia bacterium]|nr:adaptor protein MecA [Clostridia bacterium]